MTIYGHTWISRYVYNILIAQILWFPTPFPLLGPTEQGTSVEQFQSHESKQFVEAGAVFRCADLQRSRKELNPSSKAKDEILQYRGTPL